MIDIKRIPDRSLLDTSVLVAALDKRHEAHSNLCVALFEGLVADKARLSLVAPHTIAELLHGPSKTTVPRSRQLQVVSFDDKAAELLATVFPSSQLKSWEKANGAPRGYYKYDAMILAAAMRHRASCVFTLDDGMMQLAKTAGLQAWHPRDLDRQIPIQAKLAFADGPRGNLN